MVDVPRDFLERIRDLKLSPPSDARLQLLMDRNTDGRLTSAERAELAALVECSEQLSLVRAQACRLLGQRP